MLFFFSSRRRHTRLQGDWSSDVCSSDLGEGLLLRPASSVHTFFMRFAIDVVFLTPDGDVVKVASNVRPWRAVGARGAKARSEERGVGKEGRSRGWPVH